MRHRASTGKDVSTVRCTLPYRMNFPRRLRPQNRQLLVTRTLAHRLQQLEDSAFFKPLRTRNTKNASGNSCARKRSVTSSAPPAWCTSFHPSSACPEGRRARRQTRRTRGTAASNRPHPPSSSDACQRVSGWAFASTCSSAFMPQKKSGLRQTRKYACAFHFVSDLTAARRASYSLHGRCSPHGGGEVLGRWPGHVCIHHGHARSAVAPGPRWPERAFRDSRSTSLPGGMSGVGVTGLPGRNRRSWIVEPSKPFGGNVYVRKSKSLKRVVRTWSR